MVEYLPPLLLALGGVGLLRHSEAVRKREEASLHWPTAVGYVGPPTVGEVEGWDRSGETTVRDPSQDHTRYFLSYRYQIGARWYVGRHTAFRETVWYPSAGELQQQYPLGSAVLVHYNRRDPSQAVLRPGVGWILGDQLLAGLLLFGAVVWGLVIF